jgi:hypothetical protein
MVYKITERAVVKLPYQYPVGDGSVNDEEYDHLHLSLQSIALFKGEKRFYDLLFENPLTIRPIIVGRWFEELLSLVGFAYTKP